MRVRYSNKIKDSVPWDILQECIQLTYSVVPTAGIHIFHFENGKRYLRIRHNVPLINFEREIVHPNIVFSRSIEDVAVYRNSECIYALPWDELKNVK